MIQKQPFHALKFIYSEKATQFCEISTLDLTVCTVVKFKLEISQNFVPFSEYMNFMYIPKDSQIMLEAAPFALLAHR